MTQPPDHYKEPTAKEWRGFWTLVGVQAQNAFNEKAVQFLLIPLGVWLWGTAGSTLEYTLGAIFVLPYILFSPLVGWLTDCFCKTRIIQVMSFVQVCVIACMLFCFYQQDMTAAIIWFAVFATQATILSPAKKGIVKDLLGSKYIAFGSTIIETSMVFVLLAAQIGVFFWFSALLTDYSVLPDAATEAGWKAVIFPTWIFLSLAAIVSALSFLVPRYPAKQKRKFNWSLLYEHVVQVKYLWKDRLLRLSEIGICYFWCLAGSLFLIVIQIAKQINEASPEVDFSLMCGILMAWLGGGVVVGGVIASLLIKRKNELGLIPLGAIGVTISTLMLCILDINTLGSNIMLACTGAFGAAYLAPLNAFLQDHCDPAQRGNIIAAGNLIDNLMGLVAVILMWFMHEMGFSAQNQFAVLFAMSVFIMITSLRLIPQEFIRMVGIWFMRLIYRPRIINQDRIPLHGGALLVANHVTYADALFITMISPRPVRFIVAEEFMGTRMLAWVLELFNSLPISTKHPREAITKASEGIKAGDLICIFPEGQLTRSGNITPIRRGMELIARRTNAPIIPIYMDCLWGSIFSYYKDRFFRKLPRRIPYPFTVAVGERVHADEFSCQKVQSDFRQLSSACLEMTDGGNKEGILRSLEAIGNRNFLICKGTKMTGNQVASALISKQVPPFCTPKAARWLEQLFAATENMEDVRRYWMNACQIRRVNALRERSRTLLTTIGHNEPQETVISIFWPIITRTPVHIIESADEGIPENIMQIAGGRHMRSLLLKIIPKNEVRFYDFGNKLEFSASNTKWRPCSCTPNGYILSMSMGSDTYKLSDGTQQLGYRPRTRGILLPGFASHQMENVFTIKGPSLPAPFSLPENIYIDESGFLVVLT